MATREGAHEAIDRAYDYIEERGRHSMGVVIAVPHSGTMDGIDHTTVETATEVLYHERTATVLHGAVALLRLHVDRIVIVEPRVGAPTKGDESGEEER